MKTSELIVKTMNAFNQGKVVEDSGVELVCKVVKPFEKTDQIDESEMDVLPQDEAKPPDDKEEIEELVSKVPEETDISVQEVPEEQGMEDIQADKTVKKKEQSQEISRHSERIKAGIVKPERYAMTTEKMREGSHNSEERNAAIKKVKLDEIHLIFEELDAVEPVKKKDIPEGFKALGTHLFTVEKFTMDDMHDKFKSQLVSHGNEQDTLLYPDRSSPTVGIHMIMMGLIIASCNTDYLVGKLDVKGAFIQTEKTRTPVYIKCVGTLHKLIVETYPRLKACVDESGALYCKLKKALYGCVQASKLWYKQLCSFLQDLSYERSDVDLCLFRKVIGEKVYTQWSLRFNRRSTYLLQLKKAEMR
jgi:hypothetical protein